MKYEGLKLVRKAAIDHPLQSATSPFGLTERHRSSTQSPDARGPEHLQLMPCPGAPQPKARRVEGQQARLESPLARLIRQGGSESLPQPAQRQQERQQRVKDGWVGFREARYDTETVTIPYLGRRPALQTSFLWMLLSAGQFLGEPRIPACREHSSRTGAWHHHTWSCAFDTRNTHA